jgi:hypothetical protein
MVWMVRNGSELNSFSFPVSVGSLRGLRDGLGLYMGFSPRRNTNMHGLWADKGLFFSYLFSGQRTRIFLLDVVDHGMEREVQPNVL